MNSTIRFSLAVVVSAIGIIIWCSYGWPPDGNFNTFLILGAISFCIISVSGVVICKTAQRMECPNRISLKGDYDDEPQLATINGVGTRFIAVPGNPYVKYQFFCFFYVPLIPLGCYAAKSEKKGYKWYGYAKWRLIEIIGIYFKWWGGLLGLLFATFSIIGLFSE